MPRSTRWFSWFAALALIVTTAVASGGVAQAAPGDPELTAATPTIAGVFAVGETVRAQATGWSHGTTFTYQWYADGKPIGSGTDALALGKSQEGKRISVKVTGSLDGFANVSRTSAASAKVMRAGTPTVSGTLAVGSTVKAKAGSWTSKTKLSYQWLRGGDAIKGATKSSYKIASADAGEQLSVKVTGRRSGYATVATTSAATVRVTKPATPKIDGSAVVDAKLTALPGSWSTGTKFSYQWLRSGGKIRGATSATYQVGKSDIDKQLSVIVTGTQSGWGTATSTSARTAKVLKAGTPTISGTVAVGSTVKVKAGSWTSKTKLSYQWLRGGKAIKGATKSSYKIASADVGEQLTVTVTGKRTGYVTTSKTSAPRTVTAATMKASTPTITGTAKAGSTLTANPGSWTSGVTFSYRWLADGIAIPGATGKTFRVTYAQGMKRLTVEVTGKLTGYVSATRRSAATAVVPVVPNYVENKPRTLRVGVDVQEGTYGAVGGTQCYWERRKDAKGLEDNGTIASGPWHGSRVRVTLRPGEYFYAQDCGYWTPIDYSAGTPVPEFSDGDQMVGFDIQPGIYLAPGGPICAWWRYQDAGLELAGNDVGEGGVLGLGPIHSGQVMMQVFKTDKVVTSAGCGRWTLWDRADTSWTDTVGDGDYSVYDGVGGHMRPGVWRTTTATSNCYVEFASGFAGTYAEIIDAWLNEAGHTTIDLPIQPTDVRFTSTECGAWTRIGDLPEGRSEPKLMTAGAPRGNVRGLAPAEARDRQAELAD